ncbi:MAG: RHS repeat-associated core domain-containing protein [Oscillospiraceae bacterium]|jgi:RHS repeat-associated protein|nr:RHS repeat-associated core domain-containing protein [Oscillospiraceae bacterium]
MKPVPKRAGTAEIFGPEMYYLRARYYNPRLGRFTSEDPYWRIQAITRHDPQGINLYAYANNNPLMFVDPTGLFVQAALSIFLSINLFRYANPISALSENITRDWIQITDDEKYEYRIELINRFQNNSHTRLYIRNVSTGDEFIIPLDVPTSVFGSLGGDSGGSSMMSILTITNKENIYILTTTKIFEEAKEFEIDMKTQTSRRIE